MGCGFSWDGAREKGENAKGARRCKKMQVKWSCSKFTPSSTPRFADSPFKLSQRGDRTPTFCPSENEMKSFQLSHKNNTSSLSFQISIHAVFENVFPAGLSSSVFYWKTGGEWNEQKPATSQLRWDWLFKYSLFVYSCSPVWQNGLSEWINRRLGTKY